MTEIDRTTAAVARGQHGVFAAWQVPGLTKHLVRHRTSTGRWTALAVGVYALDGLPATWERDLWRALLVAGTGSVVGRRSAARLHRLPGTMHDVIDLVQPESSVPMGKPRTSRTTSTAPRVPRDQRRRLPRHHRGANALRPRRTHVPQATSARLGVPAAWQSRADAGRRHRARSGHDRLDVKGVHGPRGAAGAPGRASFAR